MIWDDIERELRLKKKRAIKNGVTKRECVRMYSILKNRYDEYVTAFARYENGDFVDIGRRNEFVREAARWLDVEVPNWRNEISIPVKLQMMIASKYGRI